LEKFYLVGLIKNCFYQPPPTLKKNIFLILSFNFSYEDIVPSSSLMVNDRELSYADVLLDAYDIFQRLEMALELIQHGSADFPLTSFGARNMWSLFRREIQKILQNLLTEMMYRDVSAPVPLTRGVISENVRCMDHSIYQDIRNFIIFRSIKQSAHFYLRIFRKK